MTLLTTNDPHAPARWYCDHCEQPVTEDEKGDSCAACWYDQWLAALQALDELVDEYDRLHDLGFKPMSGDLEGYIAAPIRNYVRGREAR